MSSENLVLIAGRASKLLILDELGNAVTQKGFTGVSSHGREPECVSAKRLAMQLGAHHSSQAAQESSESVLFN